MPSIPLPFFSDGHRIDADLHLPDDGGQAAPYPVVVAASGYQGLKVIHPERFARALAPLGYGVLAFDYRGFGLSEGERGRLVPQEWAVDVRTAVDRVSGHHDVDAERIALLGWGLGGGVVVSAAADDPRVRAVACCNGIADGYRSTRSMHDETSWRSLVRRIEADRQRRSEVGRSEITSPWDIVRLDLDEQTDGYVGDELYKAHGFGSGVTLESAEYLLRFRPEEHAAKLSPRPLLIVHGDQNQLHKVDEAHALYAAADEPKQLELLEGKGHTEWMFDDDPTFKYMIEVVDGFLGDAFDRASVGAGEGGR
ncbi:MAG: alpha/beta fold hydrolase [Actinophytocola sp.]|nr:alpha/beta fold hydrolase [Actinophytocola sp.]